MFGAKGFRAREATANYKRRQRRLVTDEVRAIRAANLSGASFHGAAEDAAAAAVLPTMEEIARANAKRVAVEKLAAELEAAKVAAEAPAEVDEDEVDETADAETETKPEEAQKAEDKSHKGKAKNKKA